MSVNPITPDVFQGGQMTDLPVFSGSLNGTELMEIVAAPTGQTNVAAGVNYQISTLLLAELLTFLGISPVILGEGQNNVPGNPYIPGPNVGRIYVDKTLAEPTYILFNRANTYLIEPLVKDIAGTSDGAGNGIFIAFSNGELADGNGPITITAPYGGYFFRPIGPLNTWTLGSA